MKSLHWLLYIAALLLFSACTGENRRMQALLEQAEEMNRTDQPFLSDSIGKALVRHYDHGWHSRNLRMRAYYMLGCAYRDMGEAPAALHYYNVAAEQADTSSADCDYSTLFRVYGQMAMIYELQNLPFNELEALESYSKYALLAKDTFNYIVGIERSVIPCQEIGDSIEVLQRTEKARRLYLKFGHREYSARVYPTAIYVSLLNGNYPRALHYMDIFEKESGLFDEEGNIVKGHEHYYNSKGLYYKGTGRLDSAEYYFRRLQSYNYQLESSEGLLSVYEETGNTDSIVKYSRLHEQALMQWRGTRQAEAIIQSSAMYRYERNQQIAEQKIRDTKISLYLLLFSLSTFAIIILLSYIKYYRIKTLAWRRQEEYRQLTEKYTSAIKEYQQKTKDYELLEKNYNLLRQTYNDKEYEIADETSNRLLQRYQEMENLKSRISDYEQKIATMAANGIADSIDKNRHVIKCREWFERENVPRPNENDLNKLQSAFKYHYPRVYDKMQEVRLSNQELLVCILLILGFDTYKVTTLLDKTPQSISNSKSKANKKLFGENGTENLEKSLQRLLRCNLM